MSRADALPPSLQPLQLMMMAVMMMMMLVQ